VVLPWVRLSSDVKSYEHVLIFKIGKGSFANTFNLYRFKEQIFKYLVSF
jgi:hypothetical protein